MYSIPESVLYQVFYQVFYHDIFLKFPVEFLLACKFVCKTWYALISDPDFVKSHLNLISQTNKPSLLLLHVDVLRCVSYDSLKSSVSKIDARPIRDVKRLWIPGSRFTYVYQLLSSCKGLVCMLFGGELKHGGSLLCLWNPATGEYKVIPRTPIQFRLGALGYNQNADDYKLVVVGDRDRVSSEVRVYSLASNSWKSIPMIPYAFPAARVSGVLFNGYYHWLARDQGSSEIIVSLDVGDEKFREIKLPQEAQEHDEYLNFGVLQGCLCELVKARTRIEVWKMLDYGVHESWTRCYIITNESICMYRRYLSVMKSFENGNVLLWNPNSLFLYDPKHGSTARVHDIHCSEWVDYFESLVSLKSGTYVGKDGLIEF